MILLLGARGMLGSAFRDAFAAARKDVLAFDREDLNIADRQAVNKTFARTKPGLVINCAGSADVDGAETHAELAMTINGEAVGILAEAAERIHAPIMHFSTDYVFDGTAKEPYPEDATPNPINVYGRSKLLGEELLQKHTARFYLIRTSWLYGSHGKNFVQTILTLGRERPLLRVVNDQHGKPTYTRDLVRFASALLEEQASFGVYHGVNESETTWFDFSREIFRLAGMQTSVEPCASDQFPRPARRPPRSSLRNTKRSFLRPWQEALYEYLAEIGMLSASEVKHFSSAL